jgi:DNA-binding transcriptional LysR family regulator
VGSNREELVAMLQLGEVDLAIMGRPPKEMATRAEPLRRTRMCSWRRPAGVRWPLRQRAGGTCVLRAGLAGDRLLSFTGAASTPSSPCTCHGDREWALRPQVPPPHCDPPPVVRRLVARRDGGKAGGVGVRTQGPFAVAMAGA